MLAKKNERFSALSEKSPQTVREPRNRNSRIFHHRMLEWWCSSAVIRHFFFFMEWYPHSAIETKWQKRWEREESFRVKDFSKKKKAYVLIEFPYPSGDGLHVGHVRSYVAFDAVARALRLQGRNVLYPIGWDAFGLPTENYAIKTGRHPRAVTDENIANFRRQMKALGLSFDWSREIDTTDPKYYRWTQWIFLQLFKKGLAYQATIPINWCPSCKIGLANEEVVGGTCERCGAAVTRKMQKQWLLKITAYAEQLLKDLDTVDYLEKIKTQQINWIGKSEGATIRFQVDGGASTIEVFTTRPDTLFGTTYLVLSPEHPVVSSVTTSEQKQAVGEYLKQATKKSDLERTDLAKEKTGVFTGVYAINPINNEKIPIWIADYVLATYGTGAIMAVPAHDERDLAFAKKFRLPVVPVIRPPDLVSHPYEAGASPAAFGHLSNEIPAVGWAGEGTLMNSGPFSGQPSADAATAITKWLTDRKRGRESVQYKLRDWIFSRQHYWGEPIPIIHCPTHGAVPVPEKDLPVELPHVEKYQPTDSGESPLASITKWVNTTCPECSGPAKRETDTMPNWAGSSWYFLRYCDPKNTQAFADKKNLEYWMPVDLYNGGMEHTVLHLLYSRFWYKVLADLKLVPGTEPYRHRHSHGIVLAEDGRKMSKSFGNVINPDDLIREYGADSVRVYEMFMGPFEDTIPWSSRGIIGVHRFLQRVHDFVRTIAEKKKELNNIPDMSVAIHRTVKKVGDDLAKFRFNTAVSTMMEFFNERDFASPRNAEGQLESAEIDLNALRSFLILLFPLAPHLASELWERTFGGDVSTEPWPAYDESKLQKETFELVVQVNGKVRARIPAPSGASQKEAERLARANENVRRHLNTSPKKIVFVKDKLINLVE
jgi:leucyl-tRNA synthetase